MDCPQKIYAPPSRSTRLSLTSDCPLKTPFLSPSYIQRGHNTSSQWWNVNRSDAHPFWEKNVEKEVGRFVDEDICGLFLWRNTVQQHEGKDDWFAQHVGEFPNIVLSKGAKHKGMPMAWFHVCEVQEETKLIDGAGIRTCLGGNDGLTGRVHAGVSWVRGTVDICLGWWLSPRYSSCQNSLNGALQIWPFVCVHDTLIKRKGAFSLPSFPILNQKQFYLPGGALGSIWRRFWLACFLVSQVAWS